MRNASIRRVLSLMMALTLIFQQVGFAQEITQLNLVKYLTGNLFSGPDKFRPLHLRYFSYDAFTNNFKLLLDKGDLKNIKGNQLNEQGQELLEYFLIGVTLPNEKFWVNLKPNSENEIIDAELAQTDFGKILLEADLQLKKDTARFTSPSTPEGRAYWNKLYKKAGEIFGSENVDIPTLTRPWIVPAEVIIRETADSAYVYKATLKVMLEQDHLKNSAVYDFKDKRLEELNEYSSQLIRKEILPRLTKEVNTSKKYAQLRQVFYSLILSRWFKSRFADKSGLYPQLINKHNLNGLTSKQAWSKASYFKQYQKSFANGEYNIKETVQTPTGQVVRSYFSGGIALQGELGIPTNKSAGPISPVGIFRGNNPLVTNAVVNIGKGMVPLEGQPKVNNMIPVLTTSGISKALVKATQETGALGIADLGIEDGDDIDTEPSELKASSALVKFLRPVDISKLDKSRTVLISGGGGDCAGLNTLFKELIAALGQDLKLIGVRGGPKALKLNKKMEPKLEKDLKDYLVEFVSTEGLDELGSTILGSDRVQFADTDYEAIFDNVKDFRAVILTGGDDHSQIARKLAAKAEEKGSDLLVIWVPKTIDNDVFGQPLGFYSASRHVREETWRMTLLAKQLGTVIVTEHMGRNSGSLTYEAGRTDPTDTLEPWLDAAINRDGAGVMNLVPERHADLRTVLEEGVNRIKRNGFLHIRTSEGFLGTPKGLRIILSDPLFKQLLEIDPYLKTKINSAIEFDANDNPKLGSGGFSVSEYISGLFAHLAELAPDLYEQVKDRLHPQETSLDYSEYVAKLITHLAKLVPDSEQRVEKAGGFKAADRQVSGTRNNPWGPLFHKLPQEGYPNDMRVTALKDFLSTALSAWAHKRSSVVSEETGIIANLARVMGKLPTDMSISAALQTAFEIVKDSVIIADERYTNLQSLADKIADVLEKEGYVNVIIDPRFELKANDPLLAKLFELEPVLQQKFDTRKGGPSFVSNIVLGYMHRGPEVSGWDQALARRYADKTEELIRTNAEGGWAVFLEDDADPERHSAQATSITERIVLDDKGKPIKKNLTKILSEEQFEKAGIIGKAASSVVAADVTGLLNNIADTLTVTPTDVEVQNESEFRKEPVRYLAKEAALNNNPDVRQAAQRLLRETGIKLGIKEASMHEIYKAHSQGKWKNRTVPAYNIRPDTFDIMVTLFEAAIEDKVGLLVLELADSEGRYTSQDPAEYVAMVYAAAMATGYRGYVFIQADHYQIKADEYRNDRQKAMDKLKKKVRSAMEAGMLNIDVDPSTLVRPDILDQVLDFERLMVNRYIVERMTYDTNFSDVVASFGGIKGLVGLEDGKDEKGVYIMYNQLKEETPQMKSLRNKLVDDIATLILYHSGITELEKKYLTNLEASKEEDPYNSLEFYGINPEGYRQSLEKFVMQTLTPAERNQIEQLYRTGLYVDTLPATVEVTEFIRQVEKELRLTMPVSIGVEERHIDKECPSTIMGSIIFMEMLHSQLPADMVKPIKEALQTGTGHGVGGIPDMGIHARHNLAIPALLAFLFAQHGTSTVENKYFSEFRKVDAGEAHLATEYQKIALGAIARFVHPLRDKMVVFLEALLYPDKPISDPDIKADIEKRLNRAGLLDIGKRKNDYVKKFLTKWEKAVGSKSKDLLDDNILIGIFTGSFGLKDLVKELSGAFKPEIWGLEKSLKNHYLEPLAAEFRRIHQAFNVTNTLGLVEEIMGPAEKAEVKLPPRPQALQQAVSSAVQTDAYGQETVQTEQKPEVNGAINGFGRVGKLVLKALLEKKDSRIKIVAINDLATIDNLALLFKHDSTFGAFKGTVGVAGNDLIINGQRIHVYHEKDPAKLPWKELGVEIAIEASGQFTKREGANKHLEAGAKRVVITAPAEDEDLTVVLGVNEQKYKPFAYESKEEHRIISNASCTTNGLAPITDVLDKTFGVELVDMVTIHAGTNDQNVLDAPHKDPRRARAILNQIIPAKTGAATNLDKVIPGLKGKAGGMAFRVPTTNVSVIHLVALLKKDATKEEVNAALKKASEDGYLGKYIGYTEEELVSGDFLGSDKSGIVDSLWTNVIGGKLATTVIWYDNEWGYSNRIVELVEYIIDKESPAVTSSPLQDKVGGIDLRAIPMLTQPMGSFSGLNLSLPKLSHPEKINLNDELNSIQRMVSSGIMPSGERLKEYVAACDQNGALDKHIDGIVACLVDICRMQEEQFVAMPDDIKELLLIVDSR